ncbi:hypothetical protein Tco_0105312 [Tanacetum coccineum]
MNNLESDDEAIDTPLVSPFPHSNNDSDDGEVLNELIGYENVRTLHRERIINRDDPIACLNKAMAFLIVVASSRFASTNNQLRTSSNPRNQATIQDGRVTVHQEQMRFDDSFEIDMDMMVEQMND